jgi:hypothetical protein
MESKAAMRPDRGRLILNLLLSAVTGFNAVLLYQHALHRNTGWFILILLIGFLLPGALPFANAVEAMRRGELFHRWREPVACLIGAVDCWAILKQWPDGLDDLSWVSLYIIASAMAFVGLTRSG